MSKLEEYYQFIDNLQNKGELSVEQSALYKRIEEDIILDEVCQHIGEVVKDELKKIRRAATFVIDYDPSGHIIVKAAHNKSSEITVSPTYNSIPESETPTEQEVTSVAEDKEDPPVEEAAVEPILEEPQKPKRAARKKFKAILNGKEITGDGATVLAETIKRIGFNRVAKLGIMMDKGEYNLVGRHKREDGNNTWQREIDGWYVYTCSQNPDKVKQLRYIAEELNLDLQVIEEASDEVPVVSEEPKPQPKIDETAKYYALPMQEQAWTYMAREKSESTANSYISTLDNAVRRYIERIEPEADSIFSFTTAEDVQAVIDLLKEEEDFRQENLNRHNSMTAALNLYLKFIQSRQEE